MNDQHLRGATLAEDVHAATGAGDVAAYGRETHLLVPRGRARCARAVPDDSEHYPDDFDWVEGPDGDGTLVVGEGAFAPVAQEVFEFEVSGLKVVQSWLNYRMRRPRNVRRSSPLDEIRPERWTAEFTGELLNVLWILEATIATYPAQRNLLERIIEEIQNDS